MKRAVLALFGLCLSLQVHGQGYVAFNNYLTGGSPFAPVYGPEVNDPQQQKWGNAAEAYPAGTQTYSGAPLAGPNYSVEGWYSLTPVSDVYALNAGASPASGSLTTFEAAGGIFSSLALIPEVTPFTNPLGFISRFERGTTPMASMVRGMTLGMRRKLAAAKRSVGRRFSGNLYRWGLRPRPGYTTLRALTFMLSLSRQPLHCLVWVAWLCSCSVGAPDTRSITSSPWQ
jgi:hypothetical protein